MTAKSTRSRSLLAIGVSVLLVGLFSWPTAGVVQATGDSGGTTFSGQAFVLKAAVVGYNTIVVQDSGSLPSGGGEGPKNGCAKEVDLKLHLLGSFRGEALCAFTFGGGNESRSRAEVLKVGLKAGSNSIDADVLKANAKAVCIDGKARVDGDAIVDKLVVNGKLIVVDRPNLEVSLLGGKLIVNQQKRHVDGGHGDITVNGLRVVLDKLADVIVSSAHADIRCA